MEQVTSNLVFSIAVREIKSNNVMQLWCFRPGDFRRLNIDLSVYLQKDVSDEFSTINGVHNVSWDNVSSELVLHCE